MIPESSMHSHPLRTPTYIDNQTLAGVVVALDLRNPEIWPGWVTQTALVCTGVLITVEDIRVSPPARHNLPSVRAYSGVFGYYGVLGDALSGMIQAYVPDTGLTKKAAQTVSSWAREKPQAILKAFQALQADKNYEPWLDYEIRKGWPTTTVILNGLVDEHFIAPISKSLGSEKDDFQRTLVKSRDISYIKKWSDPNYKGEDKEIAKILFVMGALLRGRYHDRVAELFGSNIIHHPLRDGILKPLAHSEISLYRAPNTLEYLAKLVLAGSLKQQHTEDRIRVWAENIKVIRRAIHESKSIIIPQDDISEKDALHLAIRIAQECKIRTYSPLIDKLIDHALGLGLGAASSFLLEPWYFALGFYGSRAITGGFEGHLLPSLISSSEWRLSRLAQSVPGRLRRT